MPAEAGHRCQMHAPLLPPPISPLIAWLLKTIPVPAETLWRSSAASSSSSGWGAGGGGPTGHGSHPLGPPPREPGASAPPRPSRALPTHRATPAQPPPRRRPAASPPWPRSLCRPPSRLAALPPCRSCRRRRAAAAARTSGRRPPPGAGDAEKPPGSVAMSVEVSAMPWAKLG